MILITRPQPHDFGEQLGGIPYVLDALQTYEPIPAPLPDFGLYKGVIITSRNGIRDIDLSSAPLVLTVGDETAAAARMQGGVHVLSANGNVQNLIRLIQDTCPEGPLLYLSGEDVKPLTGIKAHQVFVYRMIPHSSFKPETEEALQNKAISSVVLFSRRGAEIFDRLYKEDGLNVFCLSLDVAKGLVKPVRSLWISDSPTARSLIQCIHRSGIYGKPRDGNTP